MQGLPSSTGAWFVPASPRISAEQSRDSHQIDQVAFCIGTTKRKTAPPVFDGRRSRLQPYKGRSVSPATASTKADATKISTLAAARTSRSHPAISVSSKVRQQDMFSLCSSQEQNGNAYPDKPCSVKFKCVCQRAPASTRRPLSRTSVRSILPESA